MPKELRKIIFTNKEVLRAVQDYAIRRREPIPAGSIKGVSMVDQPEVRLDIDMLSDKDQSDGRRFKQVEDYIGLASGNGSAFMRKGECALTHVATEQKIEVLRGEVSDLRDSFVGQVECLDVRLAAIEYRP